MSDEFIDTSPAPEVLTDQDNSATPLRHTPEQKPPEVAAEPAAPKSASEAIKAAMAKVEAEGDKGEVEEKPEPKAKPEEKAEAEAPEVVAEKPDEAGEKETAKAAQSEGKADRIPSRLLPKEREVWANVPNAVKAAWERMEAEHNSAAEKYEASAKFHEELREYDEMAKKADTTIKTALDRYVAMDKRIAANFGEGVAEIARAFNKNPVEAVAQFMRASGVLPQQLGAYLQGKPAQPTQPQAPQAQRAPDPAAQQALQKVAQLEQMLQQQQEAAKVAEAERTIESVKANMPRFNELQEDIVFFLKSGRIPDSLSQSERLEAAYDMAERINPSPIVASPSLAEPAATPQSGAKSISGAPGKTSTSSGKPKIMSVRDSIAAAMRSA